MPRGGDLRQGHRPHTAGSRDLSPCPLRKGDQSGEPWPSRQGPWGQSGLLCGLGGLPVISGPRCPHLTGVDCTPHASHQQHRHVLFNPHETQGASSYHPHLSSFSGGTCFAVIQLMSDRASSVQAPSSPSGCPLPPACSVLLCHLPSAPIVPLKHSREATKDSLVAHHCHWLPPILLSLPVTPGCPPWPGSLVGRARQASIHLPRVCVWASVLGGLGKSLALLSLRFFVKRRRSPYLPPRTKIA